MPIVARRSRSSAPSASAARRRPTRTRSWPRSAPRRLDGAGRRAGGGIAMATAVTTTPAGPAARPARAAARPSRRDRRPPDRRRRRPRRRPVALQPTRRVQEIDFVEVGWPAAIRWGPASVPNRTYDVVPHAEAADYDDSAWEAAGARGHHARLSPGARVLQLVPHRGHDPRAHRRPRPDRRHGRLRGRHRRLRRGVGRRRAAARARRQPAARWSAASTRPTASCSPATRSRASGSSIAVFGINGPISPRRATTSGCARRRSTSTPAERAAVGQPVEFELERVAPGLDAVAAVDARVERVAGGFEFTEGPVW